MCLQVPLNHKSMNITQARNQEAELREGKGPADVLAISFSQVILHI